jgi:oxygen-independent coproporphyrinogen III oxidase
VTSPLEPVRSLYAHVPFCAHKCLYCAFYSEVPGRGAMDRYVRAMLEEMKPIAGRMKLDTLFFGGGTPSLLSVEQWKTIFQGLEGMGLSGAREFTVECNPATIDREKADVLRSHGVNRISMGIQSFDDQFLQRLGRVHTRAQAIASFKLLRAAGFDNINLDLMFGIPGQTLAQWRATLLEAIDLGSEHLSSYEITYEEDTPLFDQLQAGQIDVDEDLACEMYDTLVNEAGKAGVHRYEISNFARDRGENAIPSLACQHNVNYWRGGAYFGVGPSATSYVDGCRWTDCRDTARYCDLIEQGRSPIESQETLSPLRRAGEIAAFGLRMSIGWPFDQFQKITGFDLRTEWSKEIESLAANGLGCVDAKGFRLTPKGLRFADSAAEAFIRLPESGEVADG